MPSYRLKRALKAELDRFNSGWVALINGNAEAGDMVGFDPCRKMTVNRGLISVAK
jgi:hypothetical protein